MLRNHSAKVQNAGMFDWTDLRSFLAVARTGSTLAASRTLRVSQTTVARRVAALEEALAVTLFERQQAGYALTPAGEALLPRAAEVEAAASAFADAAASQAREVSGTVRLTTLEIIALTILPPILKDLHQAQPAIHIELDTSEDVRDLGAGAADIAIRSIGAVNGGGLVGRRIAPNSWGVYCSRDYAAANGTPHSRSALRRHPLIGGGGNSIGPVYQKWLRQNGLEDAVAMHHGSITGLLTAVRSGIGVAALPSFVADLDPDLVRCLPPSQDDDHSLWLLTHERVRHTPRVRVVVDFLADRLQKLARTRRLAAA
jgi:DNA-binding transcriptional LysR family regulator